MVRFVCPRNGGEAYCEVCEAPKVHHCEVLAPAGKPPKCPTHRIAMRPA